MICHNKMTYKFRAYQQHGFNSITVSVDEQLVMNKEAGKGNRTFRSLMGWGAGACVLHQKLQLHTLLGTPALPHRGLTPRPSPQRPVSLTWERDQLAVGVDPSKAHGSSVSCLVILKKHLVHPNPEIIYPTTTRKPPPQERALALLAHSL